MMAVLVLAAVEAALVVTAAGLVEHEVHSVAAAIKEANPKWKCVFIMLTERLDAAAARDHSKDQALQLRVKIAE